MGATRPSKGDNAPGDAEHRRAYFFRVFMDGWVDGLRREIRRYRFFIRLFHYVCNFFNLSLSRFFKR